MPSCPRRPPRGDRASTAATPNRCAAGGEPSAALVGGTGRRWCSSSWSGCWRCWDRSIFAVDQVSVTGNVYTDPDQLAEVVDDLRGTPVLLVDTDAVEAQLEAIPWVKSARVTTKFPDSAAIEIRERTPVATMLGEDGRSRVHRCRWSRPGRGRRAAGRAGLDQRAGNAGPVLRATSPRSVTHRRLRW